MTRLFLRHALELVGAAPSAAQKRDYAVDGRAALLPRKVHDLTSSPSLGLAVCLTLTISRRRSRSAGAAG